MRTRPPGGAAWFVAFLICISVIAIPAARGQGVDFAVEPVEGSSLAEEGGFFLIEAEPGETAREAVELRNPMNQPLELELAAVDAITGVYGGASYNLPNERRRAAGAWITLERRRVRLAGGASQTVGFRVEVPDDATSGEHLAGLSVWAADEDAPDPDDESAVGIDVRSRRIIAIQVNTPGPSEPELEIIGIDPAARPDGLYLEIAVTNTGFGLTKGQGFVELPDEGFRHEFEVDTFVPDTSIGYPVDWTDEPREGEYRGIVEITYHDGEKVARWEGTFVVGDPILDELEDRGVATGRGLPPWVLPLLGAVLLIALLSLFWLRRRRAAAPVYLPPLGSSPLGSPGRPPSGGPRRPPPPPPPPRRS